MRYDIVRQKRRYEMLDKNSKKEVLGLINFFERYQLRDNGFINKEFIYYDTENLDLYKCGIALFRTIINGKHSLTMALERLYNEGIQPQNLNKHSEIQIDARASIFEYTAFLRNSFKNMFDASLNMDPDYLLKKIRLTYTIKTISHEFKLLNGTGLKASLAFDQDKYINHLNKRKTSALFFTLYQHSNDETNDEYANLVSKIERYCKTLTHITNSKIDEARIKTRDIVKEDKKKKPVIVNNKKKKKDKE